MEIDPHRLPRLSNFCCPLCRGEGSPKGLVRGGQRFVLHRVNALSIEWYCRLFPLQKGHDETLLWASVSRFRNYSQIAQYSLDMAILKDLLSGGQGWSEVV
jgi:hypothetical protein